MNPLVQKFLTSVFQFALMGIAGWFVRKGIITGDDAQMYIGAAVPALIALIWEYREVIKDRLKFLTAAASTHPVSENQVNQMVKNGQAPPANLPKSRVPYLEGSPKVRNDGPDPRGQEDSTDPGPPAA